MPLAQGVDALIGQQTGAMMGLVALHFSRHDDGVRRQTLLLNFNFSFELPVHAGVDVHLQWRVASAEWNERLQGRIGQLQGQAGVEHGRPSVIGRGTVLVRHAGAAQAGAHAAV